MSLFLYTKESSSVISFSKSLEVDLEAGEVIRNEATFIMSFSQTNCSGLIFVSLILIKPFLIAL